MEKLKLLNFKCFIEDEISFRKCTILTGGNAVGKSSIIQALLLSDYVVNMPELSMQLKDILHISVGGPKRLIAQRAQKLDGMDFGIRIDDKLVAFDIDKNNPGLMHTHKLDDVKVEPVVPTLTGFGISYSFPIIIAGLWCAAEKK